MSAAAPTRKRRKSMARKRTPTKAEDDSPGARLRRLVDRRRKGREDWELVEAAGMTPQALSRLLGGKVKDPHLSTIEAVCRVVGSTLCDFERA